MATVSPGTTGISVSGQLTPEQVAEVGRRAVALLERQAAPVALCDVAGLRADAASVEALGLIQVAARRRGRQLRLVNASAELADLIAFMGLAEPLLGG